MLKLLACLLMLIDHIGFYFADRLPAGAVLLMRATGRLAFPIFAWMLARGYKRTRNPLIYFVRMSAFAVFAEFAIRFAHNLTGISLDGTNVLVTFALAIVLLTGYHLATHAYLDMVASLRPIAPTANTLPTPSRFDLRVNPGGLSLDPRIGLPVGIVVIMIAVAATLWLKPDYGLFGLASVLVFYIVQEKAEEQNQQKRTLQAFIVLHALFLPIRLFLEHWPADWAILQCLSILAIPLCYRFDSRKRPKALLKYFFYFFYPAHIVLLCLLRTLL